MYYLLAINIFASATSMVMGMSLESGMYMFMSLLTGLSLAFKIEPE